MSAVVCPCDGYVGVHVASTLQDAGYEVFGIVSVKNEGEGAGAVHVEELELHKASVVQALKAADVIVCDLRVHQEASIWLLCQAAMVSRTSPATFVAISHPMVWGCTDVAAIESELEVETPKAAESAREVEETEPAENEGTTAHEEQDAPAVHDTTEVMHAAIDSGKSSAPGAGQSTRERFELQGEHFTKRQPIPEMSHIFRAENTVLFRHQPAILLTYVVCPGVVYGSGESDSGFHDYFARSWHATEATALPIFGSGGNIIPTIHVKDLCAYIAHVVKHLPEQRYLFATDDSRCSQRELVRAISQYIGSGEVIDGVDNSLYTQQGVDHMLLDLSLKRSDVAEWTMHARGGLVQHLEQVHAEFIQCRRIQPMKFVINGPPCSGKSAVAEHLSVQYSLPVIRAKDILAATDKLSQEDASAVDQVLKGGKTGPGRIPANIMAKLCRSLLKGVVTKNRGYILDGFPKTLREARELFTEAREWTEEEVTEQAALQAALSSISAPPAPAKGAKGKGAAKQLAGPTRTIDDVADPRKLCQEWIPDALIMLEGPDEELQQRCTKAEQELQLAREAAAAAGVPGTQSAASHYNSTDQARRLAGYKELRAQDEVDLEYLGLVTKAKWQQELAKQKLAAKKAADEELYKKTHCKRIRNPSTPKDSATTDSLQHPAAAADPVAASEVNEEGNGPMPESNEDEPAPIEGSEMPTRGGFLTFFEQAGTAIVELPHQQDINSCDEQPSLHAALNELASVVKDVAGIPRNYSGFVPVPEPVSKTAPQIAKDADQPMLNRSARLKHVLEQSNAVKQVQTKKREHAISQQKQTMHNALMRDVMPALSEGLLSLVEERPVDALEYLSSYLLNWANEQEKAQVDPYEAPIYEERIQLVSEKREREQQRQVAKAAKMQREKEARIAADTALHASLLESLRKHESMLRS